MTLFPRHRDDLDPARGVLAWTLILALGVLMWALFIVAWPWMLGLFAGLSAWRWLAGWGA